MKKKKTVATKQEAAVQKKAAPIEQAVEVVSAAEVQVGTSGLTGKERLWMIAFGIVLFMAITVLLGKATMIWLGLALVVTLRKNTSEILRQHMSLPVVGFLAMFLMVGLAGIYSPFESDAVSVNYLIYAALTMGFIVLLRCSRRHVRALLWCFIGAVSAVAVISIDRGSLDVFSGLFKVYIDLWGMEFDMPGVLGNRLNGLFNNSNVAASQNALGILVGLYLLRTEQSKKGRLLAALLLAVNGMAFWLSVSRGAMLCLALALLVYLLVTEKGQRISMFCSMAVSGISVVFFGSVGLLYLLPGSPLPLLLTVACGLVIWLLDSLLSQRVADLLAEHVKGIAVLGGVLAVAVVVFAVAAVVIKGPYTLDESEMLLRNVSLEPGTYTVSGQWDDGITMSVYVEEEEDLLMDRGETILEAVLEEGLTVTIPEGARTVLLTFRGQAGQTISDVMFSDGTSVKLNRILLPEILEYRMQDPIMNSSSLLLRIQYMKDALKIWATSPIYGRGLSSTMGLNPSVQPVYYQSMYVHNHILQYMADMGLLGLAAFLLLMGGVLLLLIRCLRKGADALAAMGLACLVMMNAHGLMEIQFSVRGYLVSAIFLLAIFVVAFGEPIGLRKEQVARAAKASVISFWALVVVFGGLLLSYRTVQKVSGNYEAQSYEEYMGTLEKFIALDAYCDDVSKMNYIANGVSDPRYYPQAKKYAESLRKDGVYTYVVGVGEYFYLPQGQLEEFFACSREGIAQRASDAASWNQQFELYRVGVLPRLSGEFMPRYLEGVLATVDYLAEYEVDRYEAIVLTDDNLAFIQEIRNVYANNLSGDEAYEYLMELYHPEQLAFEKEQAAEQEVILKAN